MSAYMPVSNSTYFERRQTAVRSLWFHRALLVGAGLALGIGLSSLRVSRPESPSLLLMREQTAAVYAAPPQIAVRSAQADRQQGYVTIIGEAVNISGKTLSSLEVIAETFDEQGKLLGVETALLELPSLRPGESSPFRIQIKEMTPFASYRLRFRHILGASVPAKI
jgi:hypothetical protein